jgi:UDP-2-acetamido-3-amino-2,3-dideoxy-glucuronate N-acetyltransferase
MHMGSNYSGIAVVGSGYWGKNLVRNLGELGALQAICDSDEGKFNELRSKYPGVKLCSSFNDIINDSEIKAVVIATPAVTHFDLVKKALLFGKDVFVEKPLALTAKEGQELVDLAKQSGKILMVGHILQYHPAVNKLKEMIKNGDLGKIRYIYSNRLNIGKLRTEENILWSFAPHDISVLLMLLEEEPIKTVAFGGDYLNEGINDITLTILEFKNGVKGHVFVSWLHPYKEQKLIVVGSQGMAVFDDMSKEKLFLYPHTIEWKDGKIPVAQKADFQVIPAGAGEPLKLELQHFLECLQTRQTPKTDGEEGLRVLKVLEAAENALVTKKGGPNKETVKKNYQVHESAFVDEGVTIGEGTQIWHFSHILKGSVIGKKCKIGQDVVIGPKVKIGNNVKIQNNVSVYEGVTLEDDVFCGPSCVFTNVINPRSAVLRMHEIRNTIVKRGASIGANATIICGHKLGKYSFIGAGAVVTKDVPDYALMVGNPAKQTGWMCECGIKLQVVKNKAECANCGRTYKLVKRQLEIA